ncbi:hypothetical protein CEXT_82721 [Caerostris extrusa]|uniref:Uncharacterized protein n=1 Tax=Caerostris extrusa TaxID=172846 RepID=A0AAV4PBW2_CAEEX|nr:hypothetical protein CEXT_82721 [Caerostris extrusa]
MLTETLSSLFASSIYDDFYCITESSSSDGDNAGEVKNVARLVMRPPGHSGKAKKGHLVFDASFEGGEFFLFAASFGGDFFAVDH